MTPGSLLSRLTMFQTPIVWDLLSEGVDSNHFIRIVRFSRAIRKDHHLVAKGFIAVGDSGWHLNQAIVVLSKKDFLQSTLRRRVLPHVIHNEFGPPRKNSIVDHHGFVDMPSLDDTRPRTGKVNLSKSDEMRIGSLHHVHDLAAFIHNLFKGND